MTAPKPTNDLEALLQRLPGYGGQAVCDVVDLIAEVRALREERDRLQRNCSEMFDEAVRQKKRAIEFEMEFAKQINFHRDDCVKLVAERDGYRDELAALRSRLEVLEQVLEVELECHFQDDSRAALVEMEPGTICACGCGRPCLYEAALRTALAAPEDASAKPARCYFGEDCTGCPACGRVPEDATPSKPVDMPADATETSK